MIPWIFWYKTVSYCPHPQNNKLDPFFADTDGSSLYYTKISRVLQVQISMRMRVRTRLRTGVFPALFIFMNLESIGIRILFKVFAPGLITQHFVRTPMGEYCTRQNSSETLHCQAVPEVENITVLYCTDRSTLICDCYLGTRKYKGTSRKTDVTCTEASLS